MPSATELRELDDVELEERLGEYRKELLNLRFQLATGQLDNAARVGQVRRDVARVLTLLRDREIALIEGRSPSIGRPRPVAPEAPVAAAPRRARRARIEGANDDDVDADDAADVVVTDSAPVDDEVAETTGADGEDE
jgi:large subunit ribosomal protein L29